MHRTKWATWTVMILAGLAAGGLLMVNAFGAPGDGDATYIGTAKCRSCHMDEYRVWRTTEHSKNFEDLEGDERATADCLQCHTTGYGKGGFVSEEETPNLTNVGCESCHGPGSLHAEAAKEAEDAEGEAEEGAEITWNTKYPKFVINTCVECHKPHISQKKRVAKLREGG